MEDCRQALQKMSDMFRLTFPENVGSWLVEHFIAKNGQVFDPNDALDLGWTGVPKACFANAREASLMHPQLRYFEGFMVMRTIPFPIHHAWCATQDDRLVEVTIKDFIDCDYIGIEVPPLDYVQQTSSENTSVLDTGLGRNLHYVVERDPSMLEIIPEQFHSYVFEHKNRIERYRSKSQDFGM